MRNEPVFHQSSINIPIIVRKEKAQMIVARVAQLLFMVLMMLVHAHQRLKRLIQVSAW